MTASELIARLRTLPPDREVCVDVTDLGFINIVELMDDSADPGALLIIDDHGDAQDAVRAINAKEG